MSKQGESGLTCLVLHFREEEKDEEKGDGDSNVKPLGQESVMGFRRKEAWAGNIL